MQINLDYQEVLLIDIQSQEWVPSPVADVDRCMLERNGAESGFATSMVRYAPGTHFPEHKHPGGEEIFVLEGTFADEHGSYPAGTYLRNPVSSSHAPFSPDGCLIFVKLWQMQVGQGTCLQRNLLSRVTPQTLYQDLYESVSIQTLKMGEIKAVSGCEMLLLRGELQVAKRRYQPYAWFRIPAGQTLQLKGLKSSIFWIKTGHLY